MKFARSITIFTFILVILLVPLSCLKTNNGINNSASQQFKTRVYKDDLKREVQIPNTITKVAVSGRIAQGIVYAIAPELLVGVAEPWSESEKSIIKTEYQNLPVLGRIYGITNKVNQEALISLSPDIVIDIGESKDSSKNDMDNFTSITRIPFVHLMLNDQNLDEVYEKLGDLLNRQIKAEKVAKYIKHVFEITNETLNNTHKRSAIFITGKNGERILANGSYFSSSMDIVTNNIARFNKINSMSYAPYYTEEELLLFKPDVVIFSSLVNKDEILENPVINSLDAVQKKNYFFFPHIPYENMGFPPGPAEIFGLLWLLNTLYPNNITFSYDTEIKEFYKLFFDVIINP